MRFLINLLNFRPQRVGGTETYLRRLLGALPAVAGQHELVLLIDRDVAAAETFPGYRYVVVPAGGRQILAQRALEAFTPYRALEIERIIQRAKPDAVLYPQQSLFPKVVQAPCALVVHDLYHVFFPHYLSPTQRFFRQAIYPYSMRRADRIVAISDFTRRTVLERYGCPPSKLVTVPHGYEPAPTATIEPDTTIDGPYLYFPAATLPHKNHRALLRSLAVLWHTGRCDLRLVLSGQQTRHWDTLAREIEQLGIEPWVVPLGYIPYQRVWRLYQGAECVVFPSMFEGFGLPILEAVAFQKKIIVSRLEVFDELGVPKRFQIDFSDPEQLAGALAEPGRTVLKRKPWSWQECAAATLDELLVLANGARMPRLYDPQRLDAVGELEVAPQVAETQRRRAA